MPTAPFFHANISIPSCNHGRIVTDRIVYQQQTRVLSLQYNRLEILAKQRYRQFLVSQLRSVHPDPNALDGHLEKLRRLVEVLHEGKAIGFEIDVSGKRRGENEGSFKENENRNTPDSDTRLPRETGDLLVNKSAEAGLFHPLFVFLLAYHIGGPINAGQAAEHDAWTPPTLPSPPTSSHGSHNLSPIPAFHIEGDTHDIMEDHRVTVVWETKSSSTPNQGDCDLCMGTPSGTHHVFLTGDTTPRPLSCIKSTGDSGSNRPVVILFDAANAALYYESTDPTIERHSISLDVRLNPFSNANLDMLDIPSPTETEIEGLTLATLIQNFPVTDYAAHFHRLLFSAESINSMMNKLEELDMESPHPTPCNSSIPSPPSLKQKYLTWHQSNITAIPLSLNLDIPILLGGIYETPNAFLRQLHARMLRDVHFSLGTNFFPQSQEDSHREYGRTWIGDLSSDDIWARLARHSLDLEQMQLTASDLLPPRTLIAYAKHIEKTVLIALSDDSHTGSTPQFPTDLLPSIASFSSYLADSLDARNEIDYMPEPWIDEQDLLVFQTRCLFLFWCADLVEGYLEGLMNEEMGKGGARADGFGEMRRQIERMARALLRTYVAWCLFVEGLPDRPFMVRMPVGGGLGGGVG